jgi:predicted aspartyl protease
MRLVKNSRFSSAVRLSVFGATSALFLAGALAQNAFADQYYDYGMKLFQQRNFKGAGQYFDIRLKSNPNDAYAQYYRAVCYHATNDLQKAKDMYASIIATTPDANVRGLAQKQLKRIEDALGLPASGSTSAGKSSTASGSATSSGLSSAASDPDTIQAGPTIIPPNARAYFTITPGGNDLIVDGAINSRGLKFKFDTGAHSVFLGKNHLRQLGIQPPTTKATGKAGGVGGTVDTWTVPANVTVGGITKKINLTVAEEFDTEPLLGQMFFEDLEYEIDNKGRCIYFRKPQEILRSDKGDQYSIPFRKKGKHLVVALEGPKGRKTDILVDTGAYSVLFSKQNMTDLDLDLPQDADEVSFQGVGGTSTGRKFVVDELRLGPIIMRHIPVVVDTGNKGAIGKEGARDNKNQRLRFFH